MSRAAVAGEPQVVVKVPVIFQFGQGAGIINKLWCSETWEVAPVRVCWEWKGTAEEGDEGRRWKISL